MTTTKRARGTRGPSRVSRARAGGSGGRSGATPTAKVVGVAKSKAARSKAARSKVATPRATEVKKVPPAGKEAPAGGGGRAVTKKPTVARAVSHGAGEERKLPRPASVSAKTKVEAAAGARTSAKTKTGKRRLSRSRAAVRARQRRREERGVLDQLAYERQEARERASERRREKRRGARPGPPDERRQAIGWLEDIRNIHIAPVFRCSLDVTEAVSSSKQDEEGDDPGAIRQRENMRTPWLVVGRFDPQEPIGYVELAHVLHSVQRDLDLEAAINPQRLSQIRIVYADPNSRRGEGDSVVSKIGAWEFILSDVVTEIMGSGADDSDALAVRYRETKVPMFYLYFSTNTGIHVTGAGSAFRWARI